MIRRSIISLLITLAIPTTALANERWNAEHPRRTEVNQRIGLQNARIHEGVESGRITRGQAARLHAEHRTVRAEERAMAAANGGHITKREQRVLNRQENSESRQIYREKH